MPATVYLRRRNSWWFHHTVEWMGLTMDRIWRGRGSKKGNFQGRYRSWQARGGRTVQAVQEGLGSRAMVGNSENCGRRVRIGFNGTPGPWDTDRNLPDKGFHEWLRSGDGACSVLTLHSLVCLSIPQAPRSLEAKTSFTSRRTLSSDHARSRGPPSSSSLKEGLVLSICIFRVYSNP